MSPALATQIAEKSWCGFAWTSIVADAASIRADAGSVGHEQLE